MVGMSQNKTFELVKVNESNNVDETTIIKLNKKKICT